MNSGFNLNFPLILECSDSFNLKFHLVHGDNLRFSKGIYYLSGDNGSGKTSFVNMLSLVSGRIGRMLEKGNGTISFNGTDYSYEKFNHVHAADIREKFFCIFPQKAFFLPVSTRDNYLILDGSDKKMAERFSSDEYPDLLSGGQQQKLLMDIVLNENKPIWFLDEPLSNMDSENRKYFWQRMDRAFKAKVKTVFFIEHWMDEEIKGDNNFQYISTIRSTGFRTHTKPPTEDFHGEIEIFKCGNPEIFFHRYLKD